MAIGHASTEAVSSTTRFTFEPLDSARLRFDQVDGSRLDSPRGFRQGLKGVRRSTGYSLHVIQQHDARLPLALYKGPQGESHESRRVTATANSR
jgi:hypothetical protein